MNSFSLVPFRILIAILGIGSASGALEPVYRASYDPATGRPEGTWEIPDGAWTENVDGLQAAISAPTEVRYFERFQMLVLVRNVSEKPIRAVFPNMAIHPYFTPVGKRLMTGGYANARHPVRWEIEPGHEIAIPFPPKVITRGNGVVPTHAVKNREPGSYVVACGIYSSKEGWERVAGEKRRFVPADGDWKGGFNLRSHQIELLDEEVELEILAPAELGLGHGLKPSLNQTRARGVRYDLKPGLHFHSSASQDVDEHWIVDSSNYSAKICWGPLTDEALRRSELIEALKAMIRGKLEDDYRHNDGLRELAKLGSLRRPLLEVLFELAPVTQLPREAKWEDRYNEIGPRLARQLGSRRVELQELGLAEEAVAALEIIFPEEVPLPDESRFQLVAAEDIPPDVPDEGWGPVNGGLQAAALMPKQIARGEVAETFLFVRNVSQKAVYLSVSRGGGYDYLKAESREGEPLKVEFQHNYPSSFSGHISPYIAPGVGQILHPEGTLLNLLKLAPGAVWKLKSRTAVRHGEPDDESATSKFTFGQQHAEDELWVSTIRPKGDAVVSLSWEMHTANGREFRKDKRRTAYWPAKRGWSGILTTAPVEVVLSEE